jgi:hypothetical protein
MKVINKELADELGVPKPNQVAINEIHDTRRDIFNSVEKMMKTGYKKEAHPTIFKELYDEWMQLERDLQFLWGFDLDDNKIKFWNFPACSCPTMDNNDAYPYGYYTISGDCIIHGVQDNVQDVTNGDVFDALGINTDLSNANTFKENEDETV